MTIETVVKPFMNVRKLLDTTMGREHRGRYPKKMSVDYSKINMS